MWPECLELCLTWIVHAKEGKKMKEGEKEEEEEEQEEEEEEE